MATYEWRVAKNGTRRYVRIEAAPAPAPKGPQPAESDSTLRIAPTDAPTVTASVTRAKPATVRPASATTVTTTTRKSSSKPRAKKKPSGG